MVATMSGGLNNQSWNHVSHNISQPLLGFNYAQAMERGDGSTNANYYGAGLGSISGQIANLTVDLEM